MVDSLASDFSHCLPPDDQSIVGHLINVSFDFLLFSPCILITPPPLAFPFTFFPLTRSGSLLSNEFQMTPSFRLTNNHFRTSALIRILGHAPSPFSAVFTVTKSQQILSSKSKFQKIPITAAKKTSSLLQLPIKSTTNQIDLFLSLSLFVLPSLSHNHFNF
jgi:hypothetical protein